MRGLPAAAAALLLVAGCAQEDKVSRLQPVNALADAPRIVATADWSAPETVTVSLSDYKFTPDHLVFHRDRPTRLVLQNVSDGEHTFVSEGFLPTVAVKQIDGPNGSTPGPWVEQVAVPAGQTKELWFVPAKYGAWTFECTKTGHAMLGMTGVVNVEK